MSHATQIAICFLAYVFVLLGVWYCWMPEAPHVRAHGHVKAQAKNQHRVR